ncbi:MAG: S8 family peptidase, partial [Methanosarcinales archaeon]|nr:S8 family peptidase [Methanosarcinales archaeon]
HVEMVYPDRAVHLNLDSSVHVIGADLARDAYNLTGSGVTIAIIDTGIDATHESLDDLDDDPETDDPKVIAFKDFVGGKTDPYDDQGHGTHCAGIAAGTGGSASQFVGVAPGANLVGVKVLDEYGDGTYSDVLAGFDWCIENKDAYRIRVISMSLGGGSNNDGATSLGLACDAAVDGGIVVCVAAGNDGESGDATVGDPACAKKVITVGSVDDSRMIASRSSRGPTADGRIKPEVCAVGVSVVSARAGGGYATRSGTSMATPHVAGAAALILEYNPDLTPTRVRKILMDTATDCGSLGPDNDYGWGVVNTTYAISERNPDIRIEPTSYDFTLIPNSSVAVNFTIGNNGTLPLSFDTICLPKYSMESIPYQWIDGVGEDGNLDLIDDSISLRNLPFVFNFYGRNYTTVNVSSDGWVSFTSGDVWLDWMYDRGPSFPVDGWENMIFPLGDDWDPGADGGVYAKSYPQMYVITWYQIPHWYPDDEGNSTGNNTFE